MKNRRPLNARTVFCGSNPERHQEPVCGSAHVIEFVSKITGRVESRGEALRNELASNLFFDRNAKEWRGWTTALSVYGDPDKKNHKEILAVRATKDPRHGFSVMKSAPMGLVGDYEDPQGVFEPESGKWRMLPCQNIGGTRYAFFGSSDRKFHVCSFPDLKPLGALKLDLPPWNSKTSGRVWPCLVTLPDGYPSRYVMLTFDRYNYPGMKGANWTYGAMYLHHGDEAKSTPTP